MRLNEINFTFGGRHCLRDFGAVYVEKSGHAMSPDIRRNEYEIAGMAGSILMPGDLPQTLTFEGTLYFLDDPPTQAAAQERLRRMAAWLTDGRQRLIFDYEPGRYYMASVDSGTQWRHSGWMGGLDIEFTAQPYAYAVQETRASASTTGTSAEITLTLDTGVDAPLSIAIANTGTAAITGATLTANGRTAAFTGMHLAPGASLDIEMEPPIGATLSSGESALPHAAQLDMLRAQRGAQTITAALTYGSGTKGAQITARARGRWM